jgi:hypothetical protein
MASESVVGDVKAVAVQIVHRTAGGANLGVNTHERDVGSKDGLILKQQRQQEQTKGHRRSIAGNFIIALPLG